MIIFGWRTRNKIIQVFRKRCGHCSSEQDIAEVGSKLWFTLFFVPLIPMGSTRRNYVCAGCGSSIPASLETIETIPRPAIQHFANATQSSPQTSVMAIVALILAVMSPVMICLCYASIPASIAALILGHISLYSISKSDGRATGRGLAIASLAVAYPVLLLSIVMLSYWIVSFSSRLEELSKIASEENARQQEIANSNGNARAEARLREAEHSIMALQGDAPGRGNNARAVELAELFADRMLKVREAAFTSGKKKLFQLSKGQFITYVELHDDRALFLVHVPDYRKFDKEAKEELAQLAWLVAQLTVAEDLPEDADLAVAMKGTLLYGDIMVGYVSKIEALQDNYLIKKKEDLLSFFPDDVQPELADKPVNDEVPQVSEPPRVAETQGEIAAVSDSVENVFATIESLNSTLPAAPPPSPDLAARATMDETAKSKQPSVEPEASPAEPFEQRLNVTLSSKVPKTYWDVHSIAWSHHGKWLAIGKIDNTLRLVDSTSGKTLSELKDLNNLSYLNALDFSMDDSKLIISTYLGQMALFAVDQRGGLRFESELMQQVAGDHVLASSPRYPFVASGGRKGMLIWQSLEPPRQAKQLQPFSRTVLAIWLPKEGVQAKAVSSDGWVEFSLREATVIRQHSSKNNNAKRACFSADGSQCVLIESENLYWFDSNLEDEPSKIHSEKGDLFTAISFHPNQRWVAVAGRKNVLIYDVADRQPMARIALESASRIERLQFSPDGKRLAVSQASEDSDIHVYEIREK